MTSASAVELYYDPFDVEIDDNPYPVWKLMREEAHRVLLRPDGANVTRQSRWSGGFRVWLQQWLLSGLTVVG